MSATATAALPKLNGSQVLILQALADAKKPLTRAELVEKVGHGVAVSPANLSSTTEPASLSSRGMLTASEGEDGSVKFGVSAKGAKFAGQMVARRQGANGDKVPPGKLDPAVKRVKASRTYGLELLTEADLTEIRTALGDKYAEVPLDSLRQQVVNRRKQGAFSDPADRNRRAAESALRAFGPGGAVRDGLLPTATVKSLREIVAAG